MACKLATRASLTRLGVYFSFVALVTRRDNSSDPTWHVYSKPEFYFPNPFDLKLFLSLQTEILER